MAWEEQKKKIGQLHRELAKKAENKTSSATAKSNVNANPFALVTHIDGKPIKSNSSNSLGSRSQSHAGMNDGKLGEMNTGSSEKEVYSHVRTPHAQREPSVFDLVTHIDGKPIK